MSKADKRALLDSSNAGPLRMKVISRVTTYLGGNGTSNFVDLSNGNTAEVVIKVDVYFFKFNILLAQK